jgi:hypothetical protein
MFLLLHQKPELTLRSLQVVCCAPKLGAKSVVDLIGAGLQNVQPFGD